MRTVLRRGVLVGIIAVIVSAASGRLDAQPMGRLEDGTWFVRTRAFGVQQYFETGFPHGPSQFISATGTACAAIALSYTLE